MSVNVPHISLSGMLTLPRMISANNAISKATNNSVNLYLISQSVILVSPCKPFRSREAIRGARCESCHSITSRGGLHHFPNNHSSVFVFALINIVYLFVLNALNSWYFLSILPNSSKDEVSAPKHPLVRSVPELLQWYCSAAACRCVIGVKVTPSASPRNN